MARLVVKDSGATLVCSPPPEEAAQDSRIWFTRPKPYGELRFYARYVCEWAKDKMPRHFSKNSAEYFQNYLERRVISVSNGNQKAQLYKK